MSYKLVVCAALLSVVALAAPRGASFEEEALIQDSTEVYSSHSALASLGAMELAACLPTIEPRGTRATVRVDSLPLRISLSVYDIILPHSL